MADYWTLGWHNRALVGYEWQMVDKSRSELPVGGEPFKSSREDYADLKLERLEIGDEGIGERK